MTAKDLMWQLVFFPLWVIIGVILLWGLTVLEIFIKIRLPRSIFNHSGHYWRVLGIGCALMGRLRLVRQFAVCRTGVSPCRVLSGILQLET
jgi:hypothetical protein